MGIQPNLEGNWEVTQITKTGYGKDEKYMDGIDAMCEADGFIQNHD